MSSNVTFFHFYLVWQIVFFLFFSFSTKWLSFENRVHYFCFPPLVMNPLLSASNFVNSFLISDSSWKDRFSPNSWHFEFSAYQSIFCGNLLMQKAHMQKTKFYSGRKQGHFPKFHQKAEKEILKQRPYFNPFAIWVLSYRRKCSDNFIIFSLL